MFHLHQGTKFRQMPLPKLQTVILIPPKPGLEVTVIHPGGSWGKDPVLPRLSRSLPKTPESSELSESPAAATVSSCLGVMVVSLGGGPVTVEVATAATAAAGAFSNTALSGGGASAGAAMTQTAKTAAKIDERKTLASILNKNRVED